MFQSINETKFGFRQTITNFLLTIMFLIHQNVKQSTMDAIWNLKVLSLQKKPLQLLSNSDVKYSTTLQFYVTL